jgi:H+/Cl- antiporter ClcA
MIRKVRRSGVSKEEIIADVVFFLIPALLSFIAIFFFDIHQSFYQAPYYPFRFLLNDYWVYVGGALLGGLIGFFLIKLFLFGVKEEEESEKQ